MSSGAAPRSVRAGKPRGIPVLPTTHMGWWSVRLAVAHVVLVLAWRIMGPLGAVPGFAVGLVGGGVALAAIVRRGERAITVFAAILPLVLVVAFVLAELIVGHA